MAQRKKTTPDTDDTLVLEYGGVVIHTNISMATDGYKQPVHRSAEELQNTSEDWVPWGLNDDFPQTLKKEAESDTVILPGIRLGARLLYGGGLSYGTIEIKDGKRDWKYQRRIEIEKWLRRSNFPRQLMTILYDLSFYADAFPMFTLSADKKTIARVSLQHTRAPWVRLGKVNTYGEHEKAFINTDFGLPGYNKEATKPIECAPSYGAVDWIKDKMKGGQSFILPIKQIDAGRQNYSIPDWNSAREMNWVQIGKDIAKLNKAYLNNAMRPMWHVEIHSDFWPARYGKETWTRLTPAQKKAKIDDFHKDLAAKLGGVENASTYMSTPLAHVKGFEHQAFSLVKITSLENKMEKGSDGWYLATSREAGQHKVVALGLDSAMMGTIPGDGGMGAGSGSNNRVAFNQRVLLSKGDQDMYLNFMYMVAEYNNWGEELEFVIDQGLITTLDAGAEASAPVAPSNNVKGVNG